MMHNTSVAMAIMASPIHVGVSRLFVSPAVQAQFTFNIMELN
jgi:hypothetical protein